MRAELWAFIHVICSLYVVLHIAVGEDLECFEPYCTCNKMKRSAMCSGNSLDFIPNFPTYVKAVTITNISLKYVSKNELSNMSKQIIKFLKLSANGIEDIHPEAFSKFEHLSSLQIIQEPLLKAKTVSTALKKIGKVDKLKSLRLTYNKWYDLPADIFETFGNKLQYVYLNNNLISYFNMTLLTTLTNLKHLNLENNRIINIFVTHIPWLSTLRLGNNSLRDIPLWCGEDKKVLLPNLRKLYLNENYISDMMNESFLCLPKTERIYLDNSNIKILRSNVFSNLLSLKLLSLKKAGSNLRVIEDFAFNSSSLEKLSFETTRYGFDRNIGLYNPNFLFSSCPQLKNLLLNNNDLPNDNLILQKIFRPLENVESLNLENTDLVEFPADVFSHMKSLKVLNLQNNHINHWGKNSRIFGNMSSLKYLNIASNYITLINKTSFPKHILSSLEKLNLGNNPFSCTCEQRWFLHWIKTTNVTMVSFPRWYTCRQPTSMNGFLLNDYNPTDDICNPWNPLYTIVIVLSSILSVLIILGIIYTTCQVNIKNCIYLIRVYNNKERTDFSVYNPSNYEYHAFVVYCNDDRLWVHGDLLNTIEEKEQLKLCIHHREFIVGETITENVGNFLDKSWKVIIIISNNFAKSEWCQWELDVVQERRIKMGSNSVIPVLLGNIDSKHMTNRLRTLLDSTPCLRFKTGVGEKLFWKALVKSIQKPLGLPPVSIISRQ